MKELITIDCEYTRKEYAAAYLLKENKKAIFIENNTARAVPILLSELRRQNLSPESVEYVIITHVHLDHAGGSSLLLQACPNAVLLAHPKAARHMIDPSKLIKSATEVYGEEVFHKLYGEILPIPESRVRIIQDGEKVRFGLSELSFFYTRGHANHHFCIFDPDLKGVFTGDAFGVAYPLLQRNGLFIIPSSSPTDFDPKAAKEAIQKIVEMNPKRVFLTHFGEISQVEGAAHQLLRHLDFSEKLLNNAIDSNLLGEDLLNFCKEKLSSYYLSLLGQVGLASDAEAWSILKNDLELNAAGIVYTANKTKNI